MIEREVENLLEQDLKENFWIADVGLINRNVYRQNPKSDEEAKLLNGKHPDFILYDETSHPIAVVEAKRSEHKSLEDARRQGMRYANKLNARFLFLYNLNRYIVYYVPNEKPLILNGKSVETMLPLSLLKKFSSESYSSEPVISINSKKDLLEVFKFANNKLREAGITKGISRFTEFSNLLFLKLISELNTPNGFNLSRDLIWDRYIEYDDDMLLNYINHVVIPGLNRKFNTTEKLNLFTELQIKDSKILKSIVSKLNQVELSKIDTDIKGDAFEYFIQKYNSSNNDLGEYFTPRHIVKFLVDIIDPQFGDKIYDPFSGTGGMLISSFSKIERKLDIEGKLDSSNTDFLRKETIWGSEISDTARIAKMNMILTGDGHSNIKQQDSFLNPEDNKFDVVITNIPFNMKVSEEQAELYPLKIRNGNALAIQHVLKSLKKSSVNSRAAVIVPESVLSDSSLVDLREKIIKSGILEGIISLPSKIFLPYTEAKTSILLFSNDKKDDMFFYKVKNDGYTLTTRRRELPGINDLDKFISLYKDIKDNKNVTSDLLHFIDRNLILSNKRKSLLIFNYIDDLKENYIRLKDVISRVNIKNQDQNPTASVTNSDFWGLPLGDDHWGDNFISVTSKSNSSYSVVEPLSITYNPSRANVGSFGINMFNNNVAVTSAYPVFKVKNEKFMAEYIYLQLTHNNFVKEQIADRSFGTVRQALSPEDFLNIQIPKETIEKQRRIVKNIKDKWQASQKLTKELNNLQF